MAFRRPNGCRVIAAYILIETEAGKTATIAAALRDLPGASETAVLAGPYDVVARAQAHNIDELAQLVTSRIQALDGALRTMTCPVRSPTRNRSAVEHHITIDEAGEGGAQAVCTCGWRSPVFGADKTAGTMDSLQRC